jgi:predicted RNA-binding protein with TRAM domain
MTFAWPVSSVDQTTLAAGAAVAVALLLLLVLVRRRSSDARRSRAAHEAAREREPPVELGETYAFGVTEFTDHHSGDRVAVGKVEGFVVFTEDVPDAVDEGDVVRATVLSFNRGRTSADATYVGRG